jgi:hypothetical protein
VLVTGVVVLVRGASALVRAVPGWWRLLAVLSPRGALVAGAGSSRTAVPGQGAVLARHGYGALLLDGRGHGPPGTRWTSAGGAVTTSPPHCRSWMPHGVDGALQRGMDWVMYTAAGLISGAPRPPGIRDGIRAAAPRPVLLIAGGAAAHEPDAARWFQAASPATVQVWVAPRAGHTQGLATAPQAWETHVISFLNAELKP